MVTVNVRDQFDYHRKWRTVLLPWKKGQIPHRKIPARRKPQTKINQDSSQNKFIWYQSISSVHHFKIFRWCTIFYLEKKNHLHEVCAHPILFGPGLHVKTASSFLSWFHLESTRPSIIKNSHLLAVAHTFSPPFSPQGLHRIFFQFQWLKTQHRATHKLFLYFQREILFFWPSAILANKLLIFIYLYINNGARHIINSLHQHFHRSLLYSSLLFKMSYHKPDI